MSAGAFSIFRKSYTIRRFKPGAFINGYFVEGQDEYFAAMLSVQPMSGLEVQYRPEGRRETQHVKCYTSMPLETLSNGNPDRVLAFGYEFELHEVQPWQNNIINHYRIVGIKVGPAPEFIDSARITTSGVLRITAADEIRITN